MNAAHNSARMAIITEDAVPLILGKSSSERAKTTGYDVPLHLVLHYSTARRTM